MIYFYCPACGEYSEPTNQHFTIWPGNENFECPKCHTSFTVKTQFFEVKSFQDIEKEKQHTEQPK